MIADVVGAVAMLVFAIGAAVAIVVLAAGVATDGELGAWLMKEIDKRSRERRGE